MARTRLLGRRNTRRGYKTRTTASSFVGVVDGLIAVGATVNFAVGCCYQMTTADGDMYLVRRASDGLTTLIPNDPTTHLPDAVALAAWCGASDGTIVTVIDKSGNARDFTNATVAEMPKCYDGATGIVLTGTLPLALLDGGATGASGEGDGWARGDGAGIGSQGTVCIFYFGSFTDLTGYSRVAVAVGSSTTQGWALRHPVGTDLSIGRSGGSTDGTSQRFVSTVALSSLSGYVARIGSGTPALSTSQLSQRGVELAQSGTNANTMNLNPASLSIGSTSIQSLGVTGRWGAAIGLAALPDAPQLAVLSAFEQTLRGLAA